jgi:hypothetical protein
VVDSSHLSTGGDGPFKISNGRDLQPAGIVDAMESQLN